MAQIRPFVHNLEARRGQLDQSEALGVQVQRVSGTALVIGAGQVLLSITFPVKFVEKPTLFFGAEMDSDETVTVGSLPTALTLLSSWRQEGATTRIGSGVWVGGVLAIVTTGTLDQRLIVHWSAEGKAYRNPAG